MVRGRVVEFLDRRVEELLGYLSLKISIRHAAIVWQVASLWASTRRVRAAVEVRKGRPAANHFIGSEHIIDCLARLLGVLKSLLETSLVVRGRHLAPGAIQNL